MTESVADTFVRKTREREAAVQALRVAWWRDQADYWGSMARQVMAEARPLTVLARDCGTTTMDADEYARLAGHFGNLALGGLTV